MGKYLVGIIIFLALTTSSLGQGTPHINVFPPQMHQQICQESTFTRYLDIFNTGDATLVYSAGFSPDTAGWVTAGPMNGQILPGDTSVMEFNFNSAGLPLNNYYANLVINSNDPDDSELVVLTMLHVQVLNILINPDQDSICLGCSTQLKTSVFGCSEAYSFSWASEPPGFTSVEQSPVVSPQVTTTFTVTITDGNYSDQKSVLIKVTPSNGITENRLVSDFSVYPNPCEEGCVLKFSSEYSVEGIIAINDLRGVNLQLDRIIIKKGLNEITLRTGNIDAGAYVLSLRAIDKSRGSILISKKIFIY